MAELRFYAATRGGWRATGARTAAEALLREPWGRCGEAGGSHLPASLTAPCLRSAGRLSAPAGPTAGVPKRPVSSCRAQRAVRSRRPRRLRTCPRGGGSAARPPLPPFALSRAVAAAAGPGSAANGAGAERAASLVRARGGGGARRPPTAVWRTWRRRGARAAGSGAREAPPPRRSVPRGRAVRAGGGRRGRALGGRVLPQQGRVCAATRAFRVSLRRGLGAEAAERWAALPPGTAAVRSRAPSGRRQVSGARGLPAVSGAPRLFFKRGSFTNAAADVTTMPDASAL